MNNQRCSARVGSSPTRKHMTRLERLARGKHSRLSRKLVNYGHKKFCYIWPCTIKLFRVVINSSLGFTPKILVWGYTVGAQHIKNISKLDCFFTLSAYHIIRRHDNQLNDTQHNNKKYAKLSIMTLSITTRSVMLSFVPSVVFLYSNTGISMIVVMLSVVAPIIDVPIYYVIPRVTSLK